jgi:hypothetical protein
MSGCYSAIIYPLIRRLCQRKPSSEFPISVCLICSQSCELIGLNSNRRHSPINILNDDVLLNIFHLYRLAESDEDENTELKYRWDRQRWWYKLAHVCQVWRYIILGSPSRLNLHLLCTNGVPVADMLAHSPPLPLTICYHGHKITIEDESGILLALSHRDRVRHIHFSMLPNMGMFVMVIDDQFPVLEHMYIHSRTELDLPETFQAPNLRHLILWRAYIPIGTPLLTTSTAGLVTLELHDIPTSAYFPPSYLLTQLSLMAQLKKLSIEFRSPIPIHDVDRQLHQTPDMTTLPNLCWFAFTGVSGYLEGLVSRINAPSLSILRVYLFSQLSFTVPRLLQFMQTSENLRFTAVHVNFGAVAVSLHAVPWKWDAPLELEVRCRPLHWQISSQVAVQFFGTFSPVLSVVEKVTFCYQGYHRSSQWYNNVDRSQWRQFLRPFTNVKTIHVKGDLVGKVFRSLDGEPPLELLPNLEEVKYSGGLDAPDALYAFVDARRVTGHPVDLRMVDHSMFLDDSGSAIACERCGDRDIRW